MKKILIRFGFALAVTSTVLGGAAAVSGASQSTTTSTKQYCC
ncbi:MAG: hypothetical protein ACJ72O_16465 [Marmoricola sp.]